MNLVLYNLFLWFYNAALRLVSPWNVKARLWLEGRKGLMNKVKAAFEKESSPVIWMHCSSLGEFEQGRPVLEKIRLGYPRYKFLVTFFSPSGYEVRKNYKGADYVFYLPLDSRWKAKEFVTLVNPALVLWIKYDYWYYYLKELKRRNIPLLLISGLFWKDHVFFRWYGGLQRSMLQSFTHFFVQTEGSEDRLRKIGFLNVTASGDTRFDRVIEIAESFEPIPLIEKFCGPGQVIVAGSTWEEDEEEIDHFANTSPDIKFIIAPHEIDEESLKETEKLFERSVRYSRLNAGYEIRDAGYGIRDTETLYSKDSLPASRIPHLVSPNVLIIDNIGLLSRLYHYATITYVGGGFGDDGVHNVLEAAVYGKPVVFGPVYDKYVEAVELVGSGGGFSIEKALEAEELFSLLLTDKEEYRKAAEASKEYVYSKRGATGKILQFIQEKRLLTN